MATLDALIAGDLPPVGNPLLLRSSNSSPSFPGYRPLWLNSGTAALALALILARRVRPEVPSPLVILPGYGCPDLVTAAIFAGVQPVLVDTCRDMPGYDLGALERALSPSVVAVVAINFLGISERLEAIRALLEEQAPGQVSLIEDNAQWFPEISADNRLHGDLVCLSFGRGKPVSLLGGGALLAGARFSALLESLPIAAAIEPGRSFAVKAAAYNALLRPQLYALLNRNPWMKLGQTTFKPPPVIRAMDRRRQVLLGENAAQYLLRPRVVEEMLRGICADSPWVERDLAALAGARAGRLLRYPLLCADRSSRDTLWSRLRRAGLGATAMYQQILPDIAGVGAHVTVPAPLHGARFFADRLLTLPVHGGVTARHLQRLRRALAVVD